MAKSNEHPASERDRRRSWLESAQGETATTVAVTAALFGLGFITGPVLSRSLGPTGRGDLAAVLVPTTLLGTILGFGLPQAAVYLARRHPPRVLFGGAIAWALAVGTPVAAVVWALAPRYLEENDPITVAWFRFFTVNAVVAIAVATALDLHRAERAMTRYNVLRSVGVILNAALVVAFALTGRLTLTSALVAMAAGTILATTLVLGSSRRWGRPHAERAVFRLQFAYGSRVAVGTWADSVVARLDQLLLVGLVAPALLGFYAVAVTASTISSPIATGLALVLFPRIARATDAAYANRELRRTRLLALAASTSIAAVLAVTGAQVLPLVFGSEFDESTTALLLLLPGRILADQSTIVSNWFFGVGRPGIASMASVVAAVLTIVLLPPAVTRWDIEGAAAVTSLSYFAEAAYLEWRRVRLGDVWVGERTEQELEQAAAIEPDATSGPAISP